MDENIAGRPPVTATSYTCWNWPEAVSYTHLKCSFVNELKIDQSISHNGVCLTVVTLTDDTYTVTAMKETLERSNLGLLKVGDKVNVEPVSYTHLKEFLVTTLSQCDTNGHFIETPYSESKLLDKYLGEVVLNIYVTNPYPEPIGEYILDIQDDNFGK